MFNRRFEPTSFSLYDLDIAKKIPLAVLEEGIQSTIHKKDYAALIHFYKLTKDFLTPTKTKTFLDCVCRLIISKNYTVLEFESLKKSFPEITNDMIFEYTQRSIACQPPKFIKASFIHLALSACNIELFDYFINNGADVNACNQDNKTPEEYIQDQIKSWESQIQIREEQAQDTTFCIEEKKFYETCLEKLKSLEVTNNLARLQIL